GDGHAVDRRDGADGARRVPPPLVLRDDGRHGFGGRRPGLALRDRLLDLLVLHIAEDREEADHDHEHQEHALLHDSVPPSPFAFTFWMRGSIMSAKRPATSGSIEAIARCSRHVSSQPVSIISCNTSDGSAANRRRNPSSVTRRPITRSTLRWLIRRF